MSKKKADKKKGGFVRAIRNIFVFLIACALLNPSWVDRNLYLC